MDYEQAFMRIQMEISGENIAHFNRNIDFYLSSEQAEQILSKTLNKSHPNC